MNAIKCEICGSSDLMKEGGVFVCQYCGTKYSLEEARKLLGTVRIDKSDDIENLKTLATRCLRNKDYKQASNYYNQLLREMPNDPEIVFYSAYTLARSSSETIASCKSLESAFETALELLNQNKSADFEDVVMSFVDQTISYCDDESLRITSMPNFNKYAAAGSFEAIGNLGYSMEQTALNYFQEDSACIKIIRKCELDFVSTLGAYCYSKQYIKQEKKRLS